ncbi:16S rRNA (guanine(527)-N(7))-methyltransferase RsmG [Peptoniphilaceae bacterium SGI.131]
MNNLFANSGFKLSKEQESKFSSYYRLISEWNERTDITNIVEEKDVYIKHFLDSLLLHKSSLIKNESKLIDIGTGGGFPGIPLKLLDESLEVTLLDSLNKRIKFLNCVVEDLNLNRVYPIHARAEEYARDKDYREQYDIATSRAVADMRTLVEYCLAYVKPGGYFIAMKGPNFKEEVESAKNAIDIMGGRLENIITYSLPEAYGDRSLIIIKKIKRTPGKYPRGQGKPRSNPL